MMISSLSLSYRVQNHRAVAYCKQRSKPSKSGLKCKAELQDRPNQSDAQGATKIGPSPNLSDPVQTISWGGTLSANRRAVISGAAGLSIILGANFLGATSFLLGLDGGGTARKLRADVLFPVKGFRRCADYGYGYEFMYPAQWLADQTIAYRAAQRAEEARERLEEMPSLSKPHPRRRNVVEPIAAFGPAGSTGEENVSVIVAPIFEGFRLTSLGSPEEASRRFLSTIAPEGSGKDAVLLGATAREDESGQLYYVQEYTIQKQGAFFRHNVSVYASRDNLLYTFNSQCPEEMWPQDQALLRQAADSFKLIPSQSAGAFPSRL